MSVTIKGKGIVWSIGGITYSAGIVGTNLTQSARAGRTSGKVEVKEDGGAIKGVAFYGNKKTLSITIIPYSTTQILGRTAVDTNTLEIGTLVTVVDASGSVLDGSYNVVNVTQNRSVDGVATIDLDLEGSDEGVDITTAL
jgi:hypothetical protein